jgi:hypothetical protein
VITGAPPWLTIAAQRTGIDFFLALAISNSWGAVRPELPAESANWTVKEWFKELMQVVPYIPPGLLAGQLPIGAMKHVSEKFKKLAESNDESLIETSRDWKPQNRWLEAWSFADEQLSAWMNGESFKTIAALVTGQEIDAIDTDRTAGKPIPKALAISTDAWSKLSLIAGGFLSSVENG